MLSVDMVYRADSLPMSVGLDQRWATA